MATGELTGPQCEPLDVLALVRQARAELVPPPSFVNEETNARTPHSIGVHDGWNGALDALEAEVARLLRAIHIPPSPGKRRTPEIRPLLRDELIAAGVGAEHVDRLLDLAAQHDVAARQVPEGRDASTDEQRGELLARTLAMRPLAPAATGHDYEALSDYADALERLLRTASPADTPDESATRDVAAEMRVEIEPVVRERLAAAEDCHDNADAAPWREVLGMPPAPTTAAAPLPDGVETTVVIHGSEQLEVIRQRIGDYDGGQPVDVILTLTPAGANRPVLARVEAALAPAFHSVTSDEDGAHDPDDDRTVFDETLEEVARDLQVANLSELRELFTEWLAASGCVAPGLLPDVNAACYAIHRLVKSKTAFRAVAASRNRWRDRALRVDAATDSEERHAHYEIDAGDGVTARVYGAANLSPESADAIRAVVHAAAAEMRDDVDLPNASVPDEDAACELAGVFEIYANEQVSVRQQGVGYLDPDERAALARRILAGVDRIRAVRGLPPQREIAQDELIRRLAEDGEFNRWATLAHLDGRNGTMQCAAAIRAFLAASPPDGSDGTREEGGGA